MQHSNHVLVGKTVDARIIKIHRDSYDCHLCSEDEDIEAIGRLYFNATHSWKPHRKLSANYEPEYAIHKTLRVLVTRSKYHATSGKTLLYLNERRADEDTSIPHLQLDDEVFGWIIREVPYIGWVIQLDFTRDIVNRPGVVQPDLTVLARNDDLPGNEDGVARALTLETGDPVIGIINGLARNIYEEDKISLRASLAVLDAKLSKLQNKPSVHALWHWHCMVHPASDQTAITEDKELPQLFAGSTIMMVEDDVRTLEMRQQRLQENGAGVIAYHAEPAKKTSDICREILIQIETYKPDLILLDYACPSPQKGLDIAECVLSGMHETLPAPPPMAICGAIITEGDRIEISKRLPSLQGTLLRPLRFQSLIRLLAGERVQNESVQLPQLPTTSNYSLNTWLQNLYEREHLSGLAVGKQLRRQEVDWSFTAGDFRLLHHESMSDLYRKTDLRSLLDGRKEPILFRPHDWATATHSLHPINSFAYWWRLEQDDQVWLVGVASKAPLPAPELLKDTIENSLAYRKMQNSLSFHAELLSSGLLIQALTHEFYNRIADMRQQAITLSELSKKPHKYTLLEKLSVENNIEAEELESLIDAIMHGFSQRDKPTPLRPVFKRLEHVSKLIEKQYGHKIYLATPPPLSVSIPASVISLSLVNLMNNAGKHGNRHHGLVQRIYWDIELSDNNDPISLKLIAEDNGLGISAFHIDRLFRPGESHSVDNEVRHGLGLWLSRTLLNRCGANLYLDETCNAVGRGCCFTIKLPLTLEMSR